MNPWNLWSKTKRNDPACWHSLPWHLIEVGAVAELMWRYTVSQPTKTRLANRLGVDELDFLNRWIGFIAATHDLGKVSPKFQGLVPIQAQRLSDLSILARSDSHSLRHGLITASELPDALCNELGIESPAAQRYAYLTGGHHGQFWSASDLLRSEELPRLVGAGEWRQARTDTIRLLMEAFEIPLNLPGRISQEIVRYEDAINIAGLITAADWLGSDENHFPYLTHELHPRDAYLLANERASRAMGRTGWFQRPVTIPSGSFGSVIKSLPETADAYPAQDVAIEAIRSLDGPGIVVIEYPMGWGKTEIALWAAANWAEHHAIPGFYIAMPTMATSDQLHQRVTKHLSLHLEDHKGDANLQLIHGQADISTMPEIVRDTELDDLEIISQSLARHHEPEPEDSDRIQRTRWFTRRKRGLLATYGVGTVDQILMSVLLTKHFFVRSHGMSGKTIIFDEVHSYDSYMGTLFDEVLRWLGALGSPVVILSATLPQHRTQEMIAAYQEGAGWQSTVPTLKPYPRVTTADINGVESYHGPSPLGENSRSVSIANASRKIEMESLWEEVGPRLRARLHEGYAAIICNTVRQAQEAYKSLGKWFHEEELTLFHARFRQVERRNIQREVLERFGKDARPEDRKRRHVVIATQVIEQSLDLDFDLMISFFCPTDLLIQRIGRLQRHRNLDVIRPSQFKNSNAELWVVGVVESDGVVEYSSGTNQVYDEHILLRSWVALKHQRQIVIPDDIESLIETTYGEASVPPNELIAKWKDTEKQWRENQKRDAKIAKSVRIASLYQGNNPREDDVLTQMVGVKQDQDDEPFLHSSALAQTRLGHAGIPLVILKASEVNDYPMSLQPNEQGLIALEDVRPMLERSVNVSLPHVVNAGLAEEPLPAWSRSTHLRHHRLVILGDNNRGRIGNLNVKLNFELGVMFDKDVEEEFQNE